MEGRRGDRSKSVDEGSTDLNPGIGGLRKGLVLGGTKGRPVQAMPGRPPRSLAHRRTGLEPIRAGWRGRASGLGDLAILWALL